MERRKLLEGTIFDNPYIPKVPPEKDAEGNVVKDGRPSRKQMKFLCYLGMEALYGGSAGGGKSDALLMAAVQYVDQPGYSALLLRRTRPMLTQADGLVPRSKQWFRGLDATYNETAMLWTFPSGATLKFGYLDQEKHLDNYIGGAYQYLGFDEGTQFPEGRIRFLYSRLRRLEGIPVPIRLRVATNPGGPGHEWIRRRYGAGMTEAEWFEARKAGQVKYFVPAKLADNPGLDAPTYIRSLNQLDPIHRAQLLCGDWNAYEGGRFKAKWFRYFHVAQLANGAYRYILGPNPNDYANVSDCWNFVICDPACTEKDVNEGGDADPTAIGAFAVTPDYKILVLCMVQKWLDIDAIPPAIEQVTRDYSALWAGIEDNGFAIGITRACQRLGLTVKSLSPEGKGKLVRATPAIIRCEAGQIFIPEKGGPAWTGKDKWAEEFVSECVQFTGDPKFDARDDQVDCLGYACQAVDQFGSGQTIVVEPEREGEDLDEPGHEQEDHWRDDEYGGLTGWQR